MFCKFKVVGDKRTFKQKFHDFTNDFGIWWNDNKDWAIIVLPVAVGLGAWSIKKVITGSFQVVNKLINLRMLKKEKLLKELYCYDRSLGHYWKLNRELTSAEWTQVARRKEAGETLANILVSMKVI